MMALIYAVQGSFWPLLAIHLADLGIDGRDRGWIFATLAIASTAVPLGAGQLVDRVMATQRRAGADLRPGHGAPGGPRLGLGGLGGRAVRGLPGLLDGDGPGLQPVQLRWRCATSTIRAGTSAGCGRGGRPAGWLAGWVVSLVMAASGSTRAGHGAYEALWVAAAFSAAASFYCLTLPHTPPLAVGPRGRGTWTAGARAGPPARRRGRPAHVVRRLPDHAAGLPGHPRLSRGIGPAPRLGHRRR